MTDRSVHRRLVAAVERAGGWPIVLARVADGEHVSEMARSFRVLPSYFVKQLHAEGARHALVIESRTRAEAAQASGGRGAPPSTTDDGSNQEQTGAGCIP